MKKFIFASGIAATLLRNSPAQRSLARRVRASSFPVWGAALALCGLLSTVVLAADIDGKWVLESQGQNGKQTQTLTVKAEGGKLTGTMDNQGTVVDGKVNIIDGAIDGSKVTFTVVRELNGTQITRKFSGTVAGAELRLTAETAGAPGGGGAQEMVFKKQ